MHLEQLIVLACVGSALVLGIRAAFLTSKRWRLIIPAAALSLLGAYEILMDRWERTVIAPIRLDLVVEVPLIAFFLTWGVVGLIFSGGRKDKTT
jgi:hypothetical protein